MGYIQKPSWATSCRMQTTGHRLDRWFHFIRYLLSNRGLPGTTLRSVEMRQRVRNPVRHDNRAESHRSHWQL